MKFKTLITINSVLALTFGILGMLMPVQLLANYNVSLSPMGLIIYQFWGATLFGVGILTWFLRSITEISLQKRLSLSLCITNGLSCIMAFRGQYAGANNLGWTVVALFILLTIGFGFLMFIKPQT